MGGTFYNSSSRHTRATASGLFTKSASEVFSSYLDPLMDPKQAKLREARDSGAHPRTVPIILGLDVTGSMQDIPKQLVKKGLPTMMTNLIERGVPDAALLFTALGDHSSDQAPLQVGQFESGDKELDMWLTKTWLEGGGGANEGESYMLAWYFAAFHTATDSWEKRGEKGFLFTTGDEACLSYLPGSFIDTMMGISGSRDYTTAELLQEAEKRWEIRHLHVMHSWKATESLPYWKQLLGSRCIEVPNFQEVPNVLSDIVVQNTNYVPPTEYQKELASAITMIDKLEI